jgi:hypothetical protein
MDPELMLAAILREREADFVRLDLICRARAERADAAPCAPVARRPHLLRRVTRALFSRRGEAGRKKLEAGS